MKSVMAKSVWSNRLWKWVDDVFPDLKKTTLFGVVVVFAPKPFKRHDDLVFKHLYGIVLQ